MLACTACVTLSEDDLRRSAKAEFFFGNYEKAMENASALLRIVPGDHDALQIRYLIFAHNHQYDLAVRELDEIVRRGVENASDLNRRCLYKALVGRELESALADCNAALARSPSFYAAWSNRGLVHLRSGRWVEAIADYNRALELEQEFADASFGRGIAKLRLGEVESGTADIATALKLNPEIENEYAVDGIKR